MSTQVVELEGFEIELARTFTAIAAEIIANWSIALVRIAGGSAITSMNRQCYMCGACKQYR